MPEKILHAWTPAYRQAGKPCALPLGDSPKSQLAIITITLSNFDKITKPSLFDKGNQ
jgi:hypothetical protein